MASAAHADGARDLQVTMGSQASSHEWDDYNKVITTIASRPVSSVVASQPGRQASHTTVGFLVTQ